MLLPEDALVGIPAEISAVDAAPLMCAGVTTFNALRNSGARAGDLVVVQGIGGLGHLAIQFTKKMGYQTVAISGSDDKADLARQLGADIFINTNAGNLVAELNKLGGADIIIATAPSGKAINSLVDGLGVDGKLLLVAATSDLLD